MAGTRGNGTDNRNGGTAAIRDEGKTNVEDRTKTKYVRLVATIVLLFLVGVTASVALADDPFSALGALTGSTTTTSSPDTSTTAADATTTTSAATTGSTTAATTAAETTTTSPPTTSP